MNSTRLSAAINARELRYFWKDLVESMRAAEARSPETAKQVHAAFGRLRGEEGTQLDRLLWGFSPEQLAAGGAQQLVEALSSPSTDVRVLAYLNLNEITGKTNNFQPDREPQDSAAIDHELGARSAAARDHLQDAARRTVRSHDLP